jgi:hypothetical protein
MPPDYVLISCAEGINIESIAVARVRARLWSCGICGGQSGDGQDFSQYFGFPYQLSFQRLIALIIYHLGLVQ